MHNRRYSNQSTEQRLQGIDLLRAGGVFLSLGAACWWAAAASLPPSARLTWYAVGQVWNLGLPLAAFALGFLLHHREMTGDTTSARRRRKLVTAWGPAVLFNVCWFAYLRYGPGSPLGIASEFGWASLFGAGALAPFAAAGQILLAWPVVRWFWLRIPRPASFLAAGLCAAGWTMGWQRAVPLELRSASWIDPAVGCGLTWLPFVLSGYWLSERRNLVGRIARVSMVPFGAIAAIGWLGAGWWCWQSVQAGGRGGVYVGAGRPDVLMAAMLSLPYVTTLVQRRPRRLWSRLARRVSERLTGVYLLAPVALELSAAVPGPLRPAALFLGTPLLTGVLIALCTARPESSLLTGMGDDLFRAPVAPEPSERDDADGWDAPDFYPASEVARRTGTN